MKEIYFVDQTLRDAHQSLWATRMSTTMIAPIAPVINDVGYKEVNISGNAVIDSSVRYLREHPWERFRMLKNAIPNSPLGGGSRNNALIRFGVAPLAAMELWVTVLASCGIKRFQWLDALTDWSTPYNRVIIAKMQALGMEVLVPLTYALSPIHTDEFYAQKAAEAVALFKPYGIVIKDSMGILTPERTRTLVPAIQRAIGGKASIEMHCHSNTGLAQLCYIEGMKLGVDTFHTATQPLSCGNSQPSAEGVAKNARLLGFNPQFNDKAAEIVAKHFAYAAKREGKPLGAPVEYSVFSHLYGMAGGTISNLKFMLNQRGMDDRWEEVVEEIGRMNAEWGYPPNVTPYSQILNVQAVLNVVRGERYAIVPDATVSYLLGHFGKPPGPVDQNVIDKVTSLPEAKHLLNWEPPQPSLEDIRREFGWPGISDDELLLRYIFQPEILEAMYAAPPKPNHPRGDKPDLALIEELLRKDLSYVSVRKGDFALTLRRGERKREAELN